MKTLKRLSHLKETGFGQPYPRHGLILLWWFADECVEIDHDNRMIAQCDPEDKDFGFRPFHNTEGLLPHTELPYYEVGNLRHPGEMPDYVTKNYDRDVRESNADRIVVSVASEWNEKRLTGIHVMHHLGQGSFDEASTYRISQGLIRIIKNMDWPDFIRQVKIRQRRNRRR